MRLPEIHLDDRRFQDLVNEARLRINRACPEWTEHNVSDPGITLIELFAWMTEMTIYRLNRVPDKLHVALLDLLGIRLDPPSAARTDAALPPRRAARGARRDPGRARPRSATPRTPSEESIVFQTDDDFVDPARCARRPTCVQRGDQIKDVGVADGEARPQGADQLAVRQRRPRSATRSTSASTSRSARLLLQVDVDASQARGAGVDPGGPAAALGGLPGRRRLGRGRGARGPHRRLQLRHGHRRAAAARSAARSSRCGGHRMHWLRCRIDDRPATAARRRRTRTRRRSTRSPRRRSARCCPPTHAAQVERRAARRVRRHARPGLPAAPQPGAQAAARARRSRSRTRSRATGRRWELREDFVGSTEFDRHFALDLVSGEVELGPAIRETDGGWSQYGAVPPKGAVLRFTRYRHGGGRTGNVARGHADRAASHDPRRRQRHQPAAGDRRRRRRGARARPPARGDGDPHALPRRHRRGLRVPRRRGLAARRPRGLHPADRRRRRAAAHPAARRPRRPPARLRASSRPTRRCCRRSRSTSTSAA